VQRVSPLPVFTAIVLGATVLSAPAGAQAPADTGALYEMPLPGGLPAALASLHDLVPPDRSQFLVEFIRRTYNRPLVIKSLHRDAAIQSLLGQIERANAIAGGAADTLPLPLPPSIWIEAVFGGRESANTLAGAIARSRETALFYYGLLSADNATRAWLAGQPQLVAELAKQHAPAFLLAAPALRVSGNIVRVPGGEAAVPGWEALVGERTTQPASFVRALLTRDEGRFSHFYGTMSQLSHGQVRLVLGLDGPDPAGRSAAMRRMHDVFERVTTAWRIDDRIFWRPPFDPALLAGDVRTDADGRLAIPGNRRFWTAVFAAEDRDSTGSNGGGDLAAASADAAVDFTWLCEQVFTGQKLEDERRYQLVAFASRVVPTVTAANARDAVAAIRAVHAYPALVATLERGKLADVAVFAAAARRAAKLGSIDGDRAIRTLGQFQGALALVTRAATRGGLSPAQVATLVASLAAVEPNARGDYEGRLVRWLGEQLQRVPADAQLDVPAPGAAERAAVSMLAGPREIEPRFVDWEGTRYRLEFPTAEAIRIVRLLGDRARPYLSSAGALVEIADRLGRPGLTVDVLRRASDTFKEMSAAVGWTGPGIWDGSDAPRRSRLVGAELEQAANSGDAGAAAKAPPTLLILADDLLARGLMELAYAVALGNPERASIPADEAARRHDFGVHFGGGRRAAAWALPTAGVISPMGWRAAGSVLGLDVVLAEFSLVRISSRPPSRRPSLDDDHRRGLVETVALVESAALTDSDRDAIAAALRKGRQRLAAVRTAAEAEALADEIRLSPARRSLLAWAVAHELPRLAKSLSPSELLWLGLDNTPLSASFQAWGVAAGARRGCHCLQLLDRQPLEMLSGRWHSGIFATAFSDLNVRLAEMLSDLQMPAPLLAPVLASAVVDLVDSATMRDSDDRRGMVEFVLALRPERVEQYLALLTTDGPLAPVNPGGDR
jgi:hypothetical protein